MRTTQQDLDDVCRMISVETGADHTIGSMTGQGYRLYRDNESREVSPRLPKGQLYDWMWAYLDGIREGRKAGEAETLGRFAELGITLDEEG